MKKCIPVRLSAALALLWLCPAGAAAQQAGTMTLSGAVTPVVRLTSGGNATLSGNLGGGVTTQSAAGATLATVVNFGDVGPGNTNPFVCFTQPLFLRSNVQASLRAAVTAATFGAGPADVNRSDIGIGLSNLTAGGPNADISNTVIAPGFGADPCAAPIAPATGIPTYSRTLNDLATAAPGTTLMNTTTAWSVRGAANAAGNRVLVDLRLAIVPQAYTAGNFSATITVTVTSP